MSDERLCPNCNQSVEDGAVYCGNCGSKLSAEQASPSTVSQVYANSTQQTLNTTLATSLASGPNIPAYAVPHHHKQHWAVMALAFGLFGIGVGVLVPILGLALGLCGIVIITSSLRITHGWLKPAAITISALAIAAGIGFMVNNVTHHQAAQTANKVGTSNGVASINVNTPCYSLTFATELNVNNSKGSCSINAYDGTTFQSSSNVYKVLGNVSSTVDSANFESYSKQAINQDIVKNLPAFSVAKQAANVFDGSPAYYVEAYDSTDNAAMIEETILHNDATNLNKDNFFVIVHATNGSNVNLDALQSSWQWND